MFIYIYVCICIYDQVYNLKAMAHNIPVPDDKIQINIETLNGKTITLDVEAFDTIESVKTQIEEKTGIPVVQQSLVFEEAMEECPTLADDLAISDCHIENGSKLNLVVEQTLTWMLVYADGCQNDEKVIPWTVKRSDWIDNIEQKILEKITDFDDFGEGYEGLLDEGFNLFFCKEQIVLHSESQVGDYNMNDNEIIVVNGHNDGYGRFELFWEEPNEVHDDMMMGLRAKCLC